MRRHACLVALLALAAAPALSEERLLAGMPDGFAVGRSPDTPGSHLLELVPKGETVQAWSQMVSIQILPATTDIIAWTSALGVAMVRACPEGGFQPLAATEEGGYDVAVAFAGCPASPRDGRSAYLLLKAVDGREALHIVQWAWSGTKPDKPALDRAGAFLAAARLCDGSDTAPCPEG